MDTPRLEPNGWPWVQMGKGYIDLEIRGPDAIAILSKSQNFNPLFLPLKMLRIASYVR